MWVWLFRFSFSLSCFYSLEDCKASNKLLTQKIREKITLYTRCKMTCKSPSCGLFFKKRMDEYNRLFIMWKMKCLSIVSIRIERIQTAILSENQVIFRRILVAKKAQIFLLGNYVRESLLRNKQSSLHLEFLRVQLQTNKIFFQVSKKL